MTIFQKEYVKFTLEKEHQGGRNGRNVDGQSSPLVPSVFVHLLHSLRVWLCIFSTRFEYGYASSPLVSSVVMHLLHPFRLIFQILCSSPPITEPEVSAAILVPLSNEATSKR